jgi:hypothetical protein
MSPPASLCASRAVHPDLAKWREHDRGYYDVPVTGPLTDRQIAQQLPTLGLSPGDPRPHTCGKLRELLLL